MEDTNYLAHYGVEGQKWGVRRYQNEDGSLTPEGREHYGYSKEQAKTKQELRDARNASSMKRAALLKTRLDSTKPEDFQKAKTASKEAAETLARERKEYRSDKETRAIDQRVWKEQRREYIQSKSAGEKLITGLLLGPAGLYNYNSLMAANTGVSKPFAFATSAINTLLTGGAGNIAASTIIANRVKEGY